MVERVSHELGVEPELRLIDVPSDEAAERLRFVGLPTVRLDGEGIDPHTGARYEFVRSCRIYRTEADFAGQPDERRVRDALERAISV